MIKSMTGYGKAESIIGNKKITVEIKSLNSKFLDCNLRMPGLYRDKEMDLRSLAAREVGRGKVDFTVGYEALEGEQTHFINKQLVAAYYRDLQAVKKDLNITDESSDWLSVLMRLPDVMRSEKPALDEEEWKAIEVLITQAVINFNGFRKEEGKVLEQELSDRILKILDLLNEVTGYEVERMAIVKDRVRKNLEEVVEKEAIDHNRFEQEMIYYLEKFDVTEEKVRLKGHCEHFLETMANEELQGKKLGFISQEIGREINTLGSKANHTEMQKIVVQMKDELEKIKEQSLNIL